MANNNFGKTKQVDGKTYVFRQDSRGGNHGSWFLSTEPVHSGGAEQGSSAAACGDFSSSSDREDIQQRDSTRKFAEYMFDEGVNMDDFLSMDDEEQGDMVADYINVTPGVHADDFDRIRDELSSYEFSRVEDDLIRYEEPQWQKEFRQKAYAGAGVPAVFVEDFPDLHPDWRESMVNGEFSGTYDEYMEDGPGLFYMMEYRDHCNEAATVMVDEWSDRNDDPEKGPVLYVRIDGKDMGWRGRSGYWFMSIDEFQEDPIRSIAPDTSSFSQSWRQEADGKTLYISQAHHDAMGESYTVTPLYDGDIDEDEWLR